MTSLRPFLLLARPSPPLGVSVLALKALVCGAALAFGAGGFPGSAWAQTASTQKPGGPEDDWSEYNGPKTPPPSLAPEETPSGAGAFDNNLATPGGTQGPASQPGPPGGSRFAPEEGSEEGVDVPAPPPEPPNETSVFGAPALGGGHFAVGASIGFPYVSVRALYGVVPRVDVGIAFESTYGSYNDVRAMARGQLFSFAGLSASVLVDGGPAFFLQSAAAENKGMRWLTGRRNWNLAPGLAFSFQGSGPSAARLFADGRLCISFDTEPVQRDPLGGVPAAVQTSLSVPIRLGAEFPYSRVTSITFAFGMDLHTRPDDIAVMPTVSVGIVTALF